MVVLTRRRVALYTLAALAVLDLGRSLYARRGARAPRPAPVTADAGVPIAWPPGSDRAADAGSGARLFAQHCAVCHGPHGGGDGPVARTLHPAPRDLTSGIFKLKSTAGGAPPTRADVRTTLARGMPGTAMPAWDDILSDAQIDALIDYIRSLAPPFDWAPPAPPGPTSRDIMRGEKAFADLGCPACHGAAGRGDGSSAAALKDAAKQPDPPRDLTAPWTFRGGDDTAALYARIAFGMPGTPMPGYAETADAGTIAAVVAYVRSLARTAPWLTDDVPPAVDPLRRGDYLVRSGMCGYCHTPVDERGIAGEPLAGGMKIDADAHGIFFSSNLTPDRDTGLGAWSIEQIASAIRSGHSPSRRLNFWAMPWMLFGSLEASDATAIATYLKSLPPVRNRVPAPLHYGLAETVVRKLAYAWPIVAPDRLTFFAGNFGDANPRFMSPDRPQTILVWMQLAVLWCGVLAITVAPAHRRGDAEPRLGGFIATAIVAVIVGSGAIIIARYPAFGPVPADAVVGAFAASIPLPADATVWQRRGRALYATAGCVLCHGSDGSGGVKESWTGFGTTWSSNLTTLQQWSNHAIQRAIISGVGADGRPLHWRAMPWAQSSNMSIEDQHALVAFIRTLPAVARPILPPQPPTGNDCAAATLWIAATDTQPGCTDVDAGNRVW